MGLIATVSGEGGGRISYCQFGYYFFNNILIYEPDWARAVEEEF